MTKKELLKYVYEKYDLTSEDVFKHSQGWVIFTRSGIEKIQAKDAIQVDYDVIRMEPDYAVIKASTDKVQTFGSAKRGGFKDGSTMSWYIAEMAEKRALSRAILKHTGMYQHGAFGEDEADDFKDDRVEINTKQLSQMKDGILRGEYTADEAFAKAEGAGLLIPESLKYTYRKLKTAEG